MESLEFIVDEFSWYSWITLLHHVFTSSTKQTLKEWFTLLKLKNRRIHEMTSKQIRQKKHPKNHINNCTVSSFHVFFFSFLHSVTCWIFFCFNYKKGKITGYLYNFRSALRLIPVYLTSDFMTLYFVRIKWDHSDANTINGMHTL